MTDRPDLDAIKAGLDAVRSHPRHSLDIKDLGDLIAYARPLEGRVVFEMEHILTVVFRFYEVEPHIVLSDSRYPEHVLPRHVAMFFMVGAGATLEAAGRFLGRDHSSVVNALRRVEGAIKRDPLLSEDIADLRRSLEERVAG